jgi:dTDP-4-amino-4,6-dideoxy-D-galactose acyltransferase
MARSNHTDTRFYQDPNFPTEKCNTLYETWIEKSCQGYAEAVLVAQRDEQPVGYISCHRTDPTSGQIGLVGVHPNARKMGIGKLLVEASLQWFYSQGIRHVEVVTQGRNIPAARLYQKEGFLIRSLQLWYHRWFRDNNDYKYIQDSF